MYDDVQVRPKSSKKKAAPPPPPPAAKPKSELYDDVVAVVNKQTDKQVIHDSEQANIYLLS